MVPLREGAGGSLDLVVLLVLTYWYAYEAQLLLLSPLPTGLTRVLQSADQADFN
jgi:hypothetical protein